MTTSPNYNDMTTVTALNLVADRVDTGVATRADVVFLRQASRAYEIMVDLLIRQRRELDELMGEIDELKADC